MSRTEQERFWSYVVKGPTTDDCWLWTGAVADDGYGRFWTRTPDGGQKAVRPQRYAYQLIMGTDLPSAVLLLHRCDVPLCVHVALDVEESHVRTGTHHDNMLDRSERGRHENRWTVLGYRGLARQERARRSRALRDAVREHGWDRAMIAKVVNGIDANQTELW